jgi:hypothetical protein
VKHPLAGARGFYRDFSLLASSRPLFVGSPTERLVGSRLDALTGTPNAWYVSAFTVGNDLPTNAQTLLSCQCAKNDYLVPFFFSGWNPEMFLTPYLKKGGCEHSWLMVRLPSRRTSQGPADHQLDYSFFVGKNESVRSHAFLACCSFLSGCSKRGACEFQRKRRRGFSVEKTRQGLQRCGKSQRKRGQRTTFQRKRGKAS